jgi:FixJ family two-component response regulator
VSDRSSRVFLVDDDPAVCRALGRLIRAAGHEVVSFTSPAAFLAREPHPGPACLVLDLRMPGMTGLEVQDVLERAGRAVPIVFISGRADVPASVRAMKAGAVDFLGKPVDEVELLAAIAGALERDRARRADRAERDALDTRFVRLTPREREVCALVARGLLNKQIAAELGTSEKTVKVHRGRVMAKLEVDSVAELVRLFDRVTASAARGPGPGASVGPPPDARAVVP